MAFNHEDPRPGAHPLVGQLQKGAFLPQTPF